MDDDAAVDDADDELRAADFVTAAGGRWHGLLFANPTLSLPPQLTWCFDFAFEDVSRGDDGGPLSLTVEWLPVPADSWQRMAGLHVTSPGFAEPAEASVYYYIHHRFRTVDLTLAEQRGGSLRAVASVSGDIDRLGVDPVHADAWLTFTGILVSLPDARSPDEAFARLGEFTDTAGLVFDAAGTTSAPRFVPRPNTRSQTPRPKGSGTQPDA